MEDYFAKGWSMVAATRTRIQSDGEREKKKENFGAPLVVDALTSGPGGERGTCQLEPITSIALDYEQPK